MVRSSVLAAVAVLLSSSGLALAQQASQPKLTEAQELGRRLTSQSCVVCHFPLQSGAHTYGPRLSRDSLSGDEGAIRTVIGDGTPRMPGFKHMYSAAQIGAIVQYIRTLAPVPPVPAKTAH